MTTPYFIFNDSGSFEEGDESLLELGDGRPIALVDEHDDGGGFSICGPYITLPPLGSREENILLMLKFREEQYQLCRFPPWTGQFSF